MSMKQTEHEHGTDATESTNNELAEASTQEESMPKRNRTPSTKALDNIASYKLEMAQVLKRICCKLEIDNKEKEPKNLAEALAGKDAKQWKEAWQKEIASLEHHNTLTPVKFEPGMRVFKSKLLFKTKPGGKKKVRAVVQAFKRNNVLARHRL